MSKIGPNTTEIVVLSLGIKHLDAAEDAPLCVKLKAGKLAQRVARAQLVVDVSGLSNPHYVDALRPLTGRYAAVAEFLMQQPETVKLLDNICEQLGILLPSYQERGNNHGTVLIVFRCTGGKHRSQFFAEEAARMVAEIVSTWADPAKVTVEHVRDEQGND